MQKLITEQIHGEIWKSVKDFDGYYVSNFGRLWSEWSSKILGQFSDNYGYKHVFLYKNKKRYTKLIHRLVAEAFLNNPHEYKEINHKDEDKSNNCADNLEWCTRKYNIFYGKAGKERYVNMGLTQRYSRNDLKPVECLDKDTEKVLWKFQSIGEAAEIKLKDYVENYLDDGKIMDRYDFDILSCEVVK